VDFFRGKYPSSVLIQAKLAKQNEIHQKLSVKKPPEGGCKLTST
jgi:hypothetical protein